MKLRSRYLFAVCINLMLPWLTYHFAQPHWGLAGGLIASAVPLVVWIVWDFTRYRHFDALSAMVLVGVALSLTVVSFGGDVQARALELPLVSGMIGVAFLVSLALPRPLVFYLARSTMARESIESARAFEQDWRQRPALGAAIRMLTLVWGIGLTVENALRLFIVWRGEDDPQAAFASHALRYGVYAGLMLWTIWRRIEIRKEAEREASAQADTTAQ
ncbi:VC0807 family protein [Paraburkholderia sp.]|jgi:hypothetical protein|uniref:VC0807 family protein n=1 Tax=Paraburkholderia sp. TaxID=1926495 RepID=UPI002F416EB5